MCEYCIPYSSRGVTCSGQKRGLSGDKVSVASAAAAAGAANDTDARNESDAVDITAERRRPVIRAV